MEQAGFIALLAWAFIGIGIAVNIVWSGGWWLLARMGAFLRSE